MLYFDFIRMQKESRLRPFEFEPRQVTPSQFFKPKQNLELMPYT